MNMTASAPAAEIPVPAKSKKMLPILIGSVVLVLVLIVVGAKVMGGSKAKGKGKKVQEKIEVGLTLPLDEFLVNLNGGADHYLKTVVALGLKKGLTEEQFKEHIAPVRDAIITVLSSQTIKSLANEKQREALKAELLKRSNEALGENMIAKIYFTSFATQ